MKKEIIIYWLEKARFKKTRDNICEHFGVKSEMSVNGETIFEVDTDNTKLLGELMKLEKDKYLKIRHKPEMKIDDLIKNMRERPDIIHHMQLLKERLLADDTLGNLDRMSTTLTELVKKGDISVPTAKQFSSLFPRFHKVLQQLQWEAEYTIKRRREKNDW